MILGPACFAAGKNSDFLQPLSKRISPVERLPGLAAVPQDEVDIIGRLDGAGQLGLAADHRVHVADRD